MKEGNETVPRWDMQVVYPGLESPAFLQDFEALIESIGELQATFDELEIGETDQPPTDEEAQHRLEKVLTDFNRLLEQVDLLETYVFTFVATDSTDEVAQARWSKLEQQGVRLSLLDRRLTAWLGALEVESLIERSQQAADHAHALRRAKIEAEHLMSPAKEQLAAQLSLTGSVAWSRLHGDLSSQLMVSIELDGEAKSLPMSAIRNLALDADREVRRRAYEAELATWRSWRIPLAAALNGIKGEVNLLASERGWPSALEQSLFQNSMDRETLGAMRTATEEALPDFRRYLKAKARVLGLDALAFHDLFAPMESGEMNWLYDQAKAFILEHFGEYSDRLRDLAARAFDENWIDAEPRPGKRDGAFCARLRDDESRILANYRPSYDGLSTLAHELGHAYHNLNLAARTRIQAQTPMALAETASTFCQTLIQKNALQVADETGQLYILEAALQDACQLVVDISSRLQFEQAVFQGRQERPLSADELCDLMLQAQADTYGEGLDPEKRHAYMWAVKPHYYSGSLSFYNYPYTFGFLFGLGLYRRYKQAPEAFRASYDALLGATGMAEAAELAARFDIDVRSPQFWRDSLDVVREDIDRFERLVEERG